MTEIDALHRLRLSEQPWPVTVGPGPGVLRLVHPGSIGERKEGNALLVDLYVQDFALK
jgi:hypothetical protein